MVTEEKQHDSLNMSLVVKTEAMTYFNTEAFAWSKECIGSLIQFYEDQRVLWDTSSQKYHQKDARAKAWAVICIQLGMPVKPMSVDCVMKKVGNLRTYYSKERRKIVHSSRKADRTGSVEIYKSTWPFFEQLDVFLADVSIPRKGPLQMDTSEDETDGDSRDDDPDRKDNSEGVTDDSLVNTTRKAAKRPGVTPRYEHCAKKKVRKEDLMKDGLQEEAHQTAERPEITLKQEDAEDIFGKHVAHELRIIDNIKARQMAKLEIQKVLFEAQFGGELDV